MDVPFSTFIPCESPLSKLVGSQVGFRIDPEMNKDLSFVAFSLFLLTELEMSWQKEKTGLVK